MIVNGRTRLIIAERGRVDAGVDSNVRDYRKCFVVQTHIGFGSVFSDGTVDGFSLHHRLVGNTIDYSTEYYHKNYLCVPRTNSFHTHNAHDKNQLVVVLNRHYY